MLKVNAKRSDNYEAIMSALRPGICFRNKNGNLAQVSRRDSKENGVVLTIEYATARGPLQTEARLQPVATAVAQFVDPTEFAEAMRQARRVVEARAEKRERVAAVGGDYSKAEILRRLGELETRVRDLEVTLTTPPTTGD